MDLFELKRIADKLITNFPWHKDHGGIAVQIQGNSLKVAGTDDAITVIMHSDILTELEKDVLVYEVSDFIDWPDTYE